MFSTADRFDFVLGKPYYCYFFTQISPAFSPLFPKFYLYVFVEGHLKTPSDTLFIYSVFEKHILSPLFHIQNHYFFALEFAQNFYPNSFLLFLKGYLKACLSEAYSTGSTREGPSRHN